MAGSVVVPDFEITFTQTDFLLEKIVNQHDIWQKYFVLQKEVRELFYLWLILKTL